MSRRSYVIKLQNLEPVILSTLAEQGPVTMQDLRGSVIERAKESGVEPDVVGAAIVRLLEANKLKVSEDRQVELV